MFDYLTSFDVEIWLVFFGVYAWCYVLDRIWPRSASPIFNVGFVIVAVILYSVHHLEKLITIK